ncbi:MAG: hypothetical protein HDR80_00820 [Bacteroides sp.]|nr:hypothetical protein [Bacteroides sp.]
MGIKSVFPSLLLSLALPAALASCSGTGASDRSDSSRAEEAYAADDHADNDIAMTVRSILDAIRVDQPLDSAEYNYEGILTDGGGRPLYTDIQGAPGQWRVRVLSPTSAVVRNEYLGDLLPDDLIAYLLESIGVTQDSYVTSGQASTDSDSQVTVYDTDHSEIVFETLTGKTASGATGPMINIVLRKKQSDADDTGHGASGPEHEPS